MPWTGTFPVKAWANFPATTTPISALSLSDMETRQAGYTDMRATALTPGMYGGVGDGTTNDTASFTALFAANTAPNIDLQGKTWKITAPLAPPAGTTFSNGRLLAGQHSVITSTSADITLQDCIIERDSAAGAATSLPDRSSVQAGARFRSINTDYIGSNHACVYFANGGGNGSYIDGGTWTNSTARQNACFVYAANGALTNDNIKVVNITASGGCADSILLFNAHSCVVDNNDISGCRRLAPVSFPSGWSLLTGTIYSHANRTDGNVRILKDAGSQLSEQDGANNPNTLTNGQWMFNGGLVYVNVGADPATHTITAEIVGGYGPTIYSGSGFVAGADMHDNLISNNRVSDMDGFGIYLQMTAASSNNRTYANTLRDVCKVGSQDSSLPYAGISVSRGINTKLDGDSVDLCGFYGIWYANGATGVASNVSARNCTRNGHHVLTNDFTLIGCEGSNNTFNGFNVFSVGGGQTAFRVQLIGCVGVSNTLSGVVFDNSTSPAGGRVQADLIGGLFKSNGQNGAQLIDCADCKVVGGQFDSNGSTSFAQIRLRNAATRCLVGDVHVLSGLATATGVMIDVTAVDCFIGAVNYGSALPATRAITVDTAGTAPTATYRVGNNVWSKLGTPESVITAPVGSRCVRRDGGAATSLYVKESGTGNTGWVAK